MKLIDKINELEKLIGNGTSSKQALTDLISILKDIRELIMLQHEAMEVMKKLINK